MILILILILEISRHIQIQILINVCCVYWIEGSLESLQREREREREKGRAERGGFGAESAPVRRKRIVRFSREGKKAKAIHRCQLLFDRCQLLFRPCLETGRR